MNFYESTAFTLVYLGVLFIHEYSHLLAGRFFGFEYAKMLLKFMHFEVTEENAKEKTSFQQLIISLAGPLAHIAFSLIILGTSPFFATIGLDKMISFAALLGAIEGASNLLIPLPNSDSRKVFKTLDSIWKNHHSNKTL